MNCSCNYSSNSIPTGGDCSGPLERTLALRHNFKNYNHGCNMNEILVYKDEDINQPFCAECIPGISGMDDKFKSCSLNEYCDDYGTCRLIKTHPLYQKDCNFDLDLKETKFGICGPLRCYNKKCVSCIDGMIDYSDFKICIFGEW
eukprot:gene7262-11580_t